MVENRFETKIGSIRSDRGGEYLSQDFEKCLQDAGISRELTTAFMPSQNGVSECKNRTLFEKARAIVADARTPAYLWAEATATANYVTNRSPTRANSGITPYQRLKGNPPALSHLRIYGSIAWVHVNDETHTKLEPKSRKCIFVGYSTKSKAYKCYNLATQKIVVSKDVRFEEGRFLHDKSLPSSSSGISLEPLSDSSVIIQIDDPQAHQAPPINPAQSLEPLAENQTPCSSSAVPSDVSISHLVPKSPPLRVYTRRCQPGIESSPPTLDLPPSRVEPPQPQDVIDEPLLAIELVAKIRHSSRLRQFPSQLHDFVVSLETTQDFPNLVHSSDEPLSFEEATQDPRWIQAMAKEMAMLNHKNTWLLVPRPPGCRPISVKWVYKIKSGIPRSTTHFKARLVAKGDLQRAGIDYQDTFALVIKWGSLCNVVSLAAQRGWQLLHMDVKSAFLNGTLHDEVYTKQPPGFVVEGKESWICEALQSIYRLHQSPREWNDNLATSLQELGLSPCPSDPSLFTYKDLDGLVLLLVYVDDLLVTRDNLAKIQSVREALCAKYEMSLLGPLSLYLGVEFFTIPCGILMSHKNYILKCLHDLGLTKCKPASIPMDPGLKLLVDMGASLVDATYYRVVVGKLRHCTNSRFDISFVVGVVSRFLVVPQEPHLQAAVQIFRYLKATQDLAICYHKGEEIIPSGFSNSNYLGDPNDTKSTSSYQFNLDSRPTAWRSVKQDEVSKSTAEAEYQATAKATSQAQWIRNIFIEIGLPHIVEQPISIGCDNQSAIQMAINPVLHEHTKHIEGTCHFI